MHVSASELVSVIADQVESLAAIIASITSCVLVRYRIKYRVVQVPPLPAATGSPVMRQGAFFFGTGDSTPIEVITIPGINDSVLETDGFCAGYCIDMTNGDIIAFKDEILAIGATNPFGDTILSLDAAYVQSRS